MNNYREQGGLNPDTTFVKVNIAGNETEVALSQLSGNIKIYRALITQVGASDPTVTILLNTLGATPTIARGSAGLYTFIFTTAVLAQSASKIDYKCALPNTFIQYATPFQFNVYSYNTSGTATDGIFSNTLIEIRSYN